MDGTVPGYFLILLLQNHNQVRFIARILVSGLAVLITSYLLPGVHIHDFITALLVAVVLAILNTFIKPILIILTLPITVFSLGLFLLVINAFLILLASRLVSGFQVDGFWWALLFSIILSLISSFFESQRRQAEEEA
ncbi:putative membrane protein [Thermoflavifilum thermophilum]|uniref:Putative membrane protein n=1 Tax=Thermoflavifilum thermophilum TaxID=1393122 RepID=A0A1I7NB47_9BACT|nr:putative membrane protein [Thermoflavifilum thermophilum]